MFWKDAGHAGGGKTFLGKGLLLASPSPPKAFSLNDRESPRRRTKSVSIVLCKRTGSHEICSGQTIDGKPASPVTWRYGRHRHLFPCIPFQRFTPSHGSPLPCLREERASPPPSILSGSRKSRRQLTDNDGDRRPPLTKVFSGLGRAREGKGQFLQKTPLPLSSPLLHGSHNTHPPKTTAAPKGRRDEGMTRGRPRPHRGHGRPACYSISSVRIMWRAAAVSSRRRTGIFTGASSSCWGSDLPRATISRRASM